MSDSSVHKPLAGLASPDEVNGDSSQGQFDVEPTTILYNYGEHLNAQDPSATYTPSLSDADQATVSPA